MAGNSETRVNSFGRFAELTADGTAEWPLDANAPSRGDDWRRAETPPECGETSWVRLARDPVNPPAVDDQRWLLFVPEQAHWNGWDACPETLPRSAFVQCRLVDIAGTAPDHAWVRAEIQEVVLFEDLATRFAPKPAEGLETWGGRHDGAIRWRDWALLWAPQDDAGFWLLASVSAEDIHVLAGGEWVLRHETAWAGHVVLTPAAWARISGPTRP